jgi:hypothetical protein
MFAFPISHRQAVRPSGRRPRTSRPLIEDLEGRLLLSGIQGRHIGTSVAPAIVGKHIGMRVSEGARAGVSSDGTYTVRFFG